jgi:hypothetical protein
VDDSGLVFQSKAHQFSQFQAQIHPKTRRGMGLGYGYHGGRYQTRNRLSSSASTRLLLETIDRI